MIKESENHHSAFGENAKKEDIFSMKKKILAFTLALAMMVTMLAGCGGGKKTEEPAPQGGEEQPV